MANSLSKLNIIVKYDAGYIYGIYHENNLKYIGSTTNFKGRLWRHKYSCYNVNDSHYNQQIYQYIRANGKWEDFEFKIIDIYYSITKKLLNNIEGEYIKYFGFDKLLNSEIAGRTKSEYRQDNQDKIKNYRIVNKDKNKIKAKISKSRPWTCVICDTTFTFQHKIKHLKTTKHLKKANEINLI